MKRRCVCVLRDARRFIIRAFQASEAGAGAGDAEAT